MRPLRTAIPGSLLAVGLLAVLLAGPDRSTYEGHYVTGFETSAFHPCAERYRDEQWWVTADSAAWAALQRGTEPTPPPPGEVRRSFVRIQGTLSDTGSYGHLGAYDRRIRVHEVLAVLPPDSAPCPSRPNQKSGGERALSPA